VVSLIPASSLIQHHSSKVTFKKSGTIAPFLTEDRVEQQNFMRRLTYCTTNGFPVKVNGLSSIAATAWCFA